MRIIRFRVWDIQNERMVYDPDRFEPAYPDENKVSDWVFYETWQDRDDGIGRNCEVMQFTGLTDRNKTDIWEGDLVKSWNLVDSPKNAKDKIPSVCRIVWETNFWAIRRLDGNGMTGLFISDGEFGVEVIGNIYENPELLKP